MKKKALYFITMLAGLLFISCGQGPSLQQYFVEKMDDSAFLIVNIPLNLDSLFLKKDISEEDRRVISSVGKLNLLFYRMKKDQLEQYKEEVGKLKKILAENRYQHLMDFKAFDRAQGNLLLEGTESNIDEGIVFVESENFGFGVLRILGDDINPAALMRLGKKVDPNQLEKQVKNSIGSMGAIFEDTDTVE